MPYLNVDDLMSEHPKVEVLSDAAYRLHLTGLEYCARNGTDGFIRLTKARRLTATGDDVVAVELIKAGVWHDLGEGCPIDESVDARTCPEDGRPGHYLVHDFLQWNHSAAWWSKRRADQAERRRRYMARKNGAKTDDT